MPTQRVAIVTGASRGIGAACTRTLAAEGYQLALLARHEDIHVLAREVRAVAVQGSITEPDDLGKLVDLTMKTYGRIDVVVNNSGNPPGGALLEITDHAWTEVFELYLLSVIRMSRLVAPIMLTQKRGACVNITGNGYNEPDLRFPVADTLRASIASYTKLFARTYAKDGLRMNCVAPGVTFDHDPNDIRADLKAEIPMQRPAHYAEVARAVAFLASDAASYITGETLRVDGGLSVSI